MLKRTRRHKYKVCSTVNIYGETVAKALENAQDYIDRHYKKTVRGFDAKRGKHFITLKRLHSR